ncbi:MAG TPA: cellulase family glycosylhydrolase, partial [Chloroflexota bacterium]|nr:cellulase family glycosylhydrolase [Chloroflexota bacterium]
ILTVTDYRYRPCGAAVGYPIKQTATAWRFLARQFKTDPDVAFELFNEATGGTTENDWQLWRYGGGERVGMQALVNVIRDSGAENVIIAGGTARAETFEHIGVSRLLHEVGRWGRGIAYAIHAYQFEKDYNARIGKSVRWDQRFGFLTTRVPVIATEWHFGPAGCRIEAGNPASSEAIAPALFRYLDRHNIGLLAWAFDVSNTIVVTNGTNWTWQPTRCGSRYQGAGQVLRQWFVAKP